MGLYLSVLSEAEVLSLIGFIREHVSSKADSFTTGQWQSRFIVNSILSRIYENQDGLSPRDALGYLKALLEPSFAPSVLRLRPPMGDPPGDSLTSRDKTDARHIRRQYSCCVSPLRFCRFMCSSHASLLNAFFAIMPSCLRRLIYQSRWEILTDTIGGVYLLVLVRRSIGFNLAEHLAIDETVIGVLSLHPDCRHEHLPCQIPRGTGTFTSPPVVSFAAREFLWTMTRPSYVVTSNRGGCRDRHRGLRRSS